MRTEEFDFELPEELIAQTPREVRGTSRLMVVDRRSNTLSHAQVSDLPEIIPAGAVVVINDSKVRKARLFGATETGSKVELLLIERLDGRKWRALTTRGRRNRPGKRLKLPGGLAGSFVADDPPFKIVEIEGEIDDAYLERNGHVPLPPYIHREDTRLDAERYQTVYARTVGSVASPTAGLHLTHEILQQIEARGAKVKAVTLHVGPGTFFPIRGEKIEGHLMHEESYSVPEETAAEVNRAKAEGRPVLAVGTTSVRTLESAWVGDGLRPGNGRTRLYIRPGYCFRVVDMMFTNFHTPKSTLIVLTASFAGIDLTRTAYAEAVAQRYRFFSYGDAMLVV